MVSHAKRGHNTIAEALATSAILEGNIIQQNIRWDHEARFDGVCRNKVAGVGWVLRAARELLLNGQSNFKTFTITSANVCNENRDRHQWNCVAIRPITRWQAPNIEIKIKSNLALANLLA